MDTLIWWLALIVAIAFFWFYRKLILDNGKVLLASIKKRFNRG